jgi:hypothetical protein
LSVIRAGDIRQFTFDGKEYDPAPESSCTVMEGGRANDPKINGNGSLHNSQKRTLAGIKDLTLSIDDERDDLGALQAAADTGLAKATTLTLASGVTYSGSLIITSDELGKGTSEGTLQASLLGESFEQI